MPDLRDTDEARQIERSWPWVEASIIAIEDGRRPLEPLRIRPSYRNRARAAPGRAPLPKSWSAPRPPKTLVERIAALNLGERVSCYGHPRFYIDMARTLVCAEWKAAPKDDLLWIVERVA